MGLVEAPSYGRVKKERLAADSTALCEWCSEAAIYRYALWRRGSGPRGPFAVPSGQWLLCCAEHTHQASLHASHALRTVRQ